MKRHPSITSNASSCSGPTTRRLRNVCCYQPAIRRAALICLPSAAISFGLKYLDQDWEYNFLEEYVNKETAYQNFTWLLGFFIVFHTSHAYQRFQQGSEMLYKIMGNFCDLTSVLFAFTRASDTSWEEKHGFHHLLVRLMSLLFAVSVAELEDGVGEERAYDYRLLDVACLGEAAVQRIDDATSKAEVVCHMTQSLIVDSIDSGVLAIPAPLLTRAFQELGSGMVQLHSARAFKEVPVPSPFIVVTNFLLFVHWCVTPMYMAHWSVGPISSAFWTFVVIFVLLVLHGVAMELDNPFGGDMNDLGMEEMQHDFNIRLLSMLVEVNDRTPPLKAQDLDTERLSRNYNRKGTLFSQGFRAATARLSMCQDDGTNEPQNAYARQLSAEGSISPTAGPMIKSSSDASLPPKKEGEPAENKVLSTVNEAAEQCRSCGGLGCASCVFELEQQLSHDSLGAGSQRSPQHRSSARRRPPIDVKPDVLSSAHVSSAWANLSAPFDTGLALPLPDDHWVPGDTQAMEGGVSAADHGVVQADLRSADKVSVATYAQLAVDQGMAGSVATI